MADSEKLEVCVLFKVAVPKGSNEVYLAGSFNDWNPCGKPLDRLEQSDVFIATLELLNGQVIEYKYTQGIWDSVETRADGADRPNRRIVVKPDNPGSMMIVDVVEKWKDCPLECIVCGQNKQPTTNAEAVLGDPEDFEEMIGKCQQCGVLVCGACANHENHLFGKQEFAGVAASFVNDEILRGRKIGEIMDEVWRRFGVEIRVIYRCPKCGGLLGPGRERKITR